MQIDPHTPVFTRACTCSRIADRKYHDDFKRCEVKKPIIRSSRNNGEKNRLDLCQVQERSNVILLVVFHCVLGL